MEFIASWLTPIVLLPILCSSLSGIVVDLRKAMPLALRISLGFSLVILIGTLATNFGPTAKYAEWIIVVAAFLPLLVQLQGFFSCIRDRLTWVLLGLSYLIAGLPILMYGKVSWPGWVQLDDTATFLAITDRLFSAGNVLPVQLLSTYDRVIDVVLGGSFYGTYDASTNTSLFSYPVGSLMPLGFLGEITPIDRAWLYFPYLAFAVAITAGLFFLIFRKVIVRGWLAMALAVTAAHASTFYAYALWGGIKEVTLVPVLLLSLVCLEKVFDNLVQRKFDRESAALVGVAFLTIFAIAGKSGAGFILAELFIFTLIALFHMGKIRISRRLLLFLLSLAVVGLLTRHLISDFFNKYLIPEIPDSGNFARPLNPLQILGIWPSGDFRGDIYWKPFSYLALGLVIAIAVIGLLNSLLQGAKPLAVGALASIAIALYSSTYSGVWLTGKALAVASPFILSMVLLGATTILTSSGVFAIRKRTFTFRPLLLRATGISLVVMTVAGVATSDFLAYRHLWVAPSAKVKELKEIGNRFAGQGPALMTDYSVFGARYFLRDLQAEAASELRVKPIPMRDGKELEKGFAADIDLFDDAVVGEYPLLVLKHTSSGSRPRFNYELAFSGDFYDVWRKKDDIKGEIVSLGLGDNYFPGQVISCDQIKELTSQVNGDIYGAVRETSYLIDLGDVVLAEGWSKDESSYGAVIPRSAGTIRTIVDLGKSSTYEIFIAGSYGGRLTLAIDNQVEFQGSTFFEGNKYLSNFLTRTSLSAGKHLIEISYERPWWRPGAGVVQSLGPLFLSPQVAAESSVLVAPAANPEKLCGKSLDWISWFKQSETTRDSLRP